MVKLTKTIKVKIGKLSKNKQKILDRLLTKNTKAINFCLDKFKEGNLITHKLVYKDLRKLNLPATVIHGARNKSGRNITKRFFSATCQEEQASINYASNSIKPESKALKDNIVGNLNGGHKLL